MTLQERYEWACADKDIGALIPVLVQYGERCRHITEFGIRDGASATAWVYANPDKLVCYDVGRYSSVDEIARIALENIVKFEFHQENTAYANGNMEKTDLLFIDTVHNAGQLRLELNAHYLVSKYIILHDTEIYGICGEGGESGLWVALLPFLQREHWRIKEVRPESNGLTVLERIS